MGRIILNCQVYARAKTFAQTHFFMTFEKLTKYLNVNVNSGLAKYPEQFVREITFRPEPIGPLVPAENLLFNKSRRSTDYLAELFTFWTVSPDTNVNEQFQHRVGQKQHPCPTAFCFVGEIAVPLLRLGLKSNILMWWRTKGFIENALTIFTLNNSPKLHRTILLIPFGNNGGILQQ